MLDDSYVTVVQQVMGPEVAAGVREYFSPGRRPSLEDVPDWGAGTDEGEEEEWISRGVCN